ncbi:MAG: transglutaminase-like cysteine peptidase, partial [Pseudomonadota bacterium]|nr:transglutaminase-like cysteine peptidase [Pseudomonadota bacterium]
MPKNRGLMTKMKALLARKRLGELLVMNGVLTPKELRYALHTQKTDGRNLGRILLSQNLVTRRDLYNTLGQQFSLRCLAWTLGIFLTFSSFGIKPARAGSIKDIPGQMSVVSEAFTKVSSYPALFGSDERRSSDLKAFTKWTSMFDRYEVAMKQPSNKRTIDAWKRSLSEFKDLPMDTMVERVNTFVNQTDYIVDSRNWGKSDYWSTPVEFFQRGGDCEDFAIAKYASLRALGFPENRMRVAIVHDIQKDIPHAVLIVY